MLPVLLTFGHVLPLRTDIHKYLFCSTWTVDYCMILGDWLEDSGWCSTITEPEITSSGKAQPFSSASYVSRTRYTHQVTAAPLHILMMKAYESYTKSSEVSSSFFCWKEKKEKECPQFHYWSTTLNFQLTILMFVRSICLGDFGLYTSSIQKLLPWFFVLDHSNYAHWLSVHLCDMMLLQKTHPDIATHFYKSMFVVSKTKMVFLSIGIDHAHEQNDKFVKGDESKNFYFHNSVGLFTITVSKIHTHMSNLC